jgi:hypothetical protein
MDSQIIILTPTLKFFKQEEKSSSAYRREIKFRNPR